jgi:hypothetical protein
VLDHQLSLENPVFCSYLPINFLMSKNRTKFLTHGNHRLYETVAAKSGFGDDTTRDLV